MNKVARIIAASASLVLAATAFAGEVRLRADSTNVYVGVPFAVAIEITEEKSHTPPTFPPLESAEVHDAGVSSSSSSSFQITFNGRRVMSSNTTRYAFRITPQKMGVLRIPAIEVQVDGKTLRTQPAIFRVAKSEKGDLLFVHVVSDKPSVYVGEAIEVVLEVWLKPFRQGREELDHNDMWQMISRENSQWGPFADMILPRRPEVRVRVDHRIDADGQQEQYFVYECRKTIHPQRAGSLLGDDLRVVVDYPVRIARTRGFLSLANRRVAESRPIAAGVEGETPEVKALPTKGRPPWFTGAVGVHTITASASPTEVRVGDPITLNLTVRGQGVLETLQAPLLAKMPEVTRDFQVADEQLPGVIENGAKRFTQSIRALRDDVNEIPPIPFSFFDPQREAFMTVRTNAIPLKVSAAPRMAATQIVEAGGSGARAVHSLTALDTGIESNYSDPAELLRSDRFVWSARTVAVLGGAPLMYVACALLQWRRRFLVSNVALRRRRGALKAARRKLREARQSGDVAGAMAAVLGYVADRLDLPAGGMTRAEAVRHLEEAVRDDGVVARVDAVLESCEAARFGGGGEAVEALFPRIGSCLKELERQRF